MGSTHVRVILDAGSPYVGESCPVSKVRLKPGDEVVLCQQGDTVTAISLEVWQEFLPDAWQGRCRICGSRASVGVPAALQKVSPAPASATKAEPKSVSTSSRAASTPPTPISQRRWGSQRQSISPFVIGGTLVGLVLAYAVSLMFNDPNVSNTVLSWLGRYMAIDNIATFLAAHTVLLERLYLVFGGIGLSSGLAIGSFKVLRHFGHPLMATWSIISLFILVGFLHFAGVFNLPFEQTSIAALSPESTVVTPTATLTFASTLPIKVTPLALNTNAPSLAIDFLIDKVEGKADTVKLGITIKRHQGAQPLPWTSDENRENEIYLQADSQRYPLVDLGGLFKQNATLQPGQSYRGWLTFERPAQDTFILHYPDVRPVQISLEKLDVEETDLTTVTPSLTSSPIVLSEVLFQDNSDDSRNNWVLNTNNDVVQEIRDGKLWIAINTDEEEVTAWTSLNEHFTDFVLEVDAIYERGVSNHEYGVLVRKQDDHNFYQFALVNNAFNAWKYENGKWIELKELTTSPAINQPGGTNRLKVIANGSQFRFYVNEELLTTFNDDTFATGGIGFLVAIYDPGEAKVTFDNLTIQHVEGVELADVPQSSAATPRPVSADTYKLVYTKWDGSNHNIYVADTNGINEQLIFSRGAGPSWSPDGASIFFYGEPGVDRQVRDGGERVFDGISQGIITMAASPLPTKVDQLRLFQASAWKQDSARWASVSPDGKKLAFDADPTSDYRIYFLDVTGAQQLPFEILGEQADWSPDSQRIAYRSGRDNKTGIWISNWNDTGHTPITNNGSDSFPAWSPDGKTVAFSRDDGQGNVDIYTVNVDGGNLQRLTYAPGHDTLPVYTPSGDIIFRSARTGRWGIWKMSGNGANQIEIIFNASVGPDWAYSKMDVSQK